MAAAQQLDEPRSPFGSPNPESLRIGFRPATLDDPPSSPLPHPSTSPESLDDPQPPASDSGDEWDEASSPESLAGDSFTTGSDSRSDAEAVQVDLFTEEDLQAIARGGVQFAGEKAHELVATTPGRQAVGLLLTDEQDQAQIGDPLARIAARHAGDVGGKVNPDTRDLLASFVGIAGYGLKQFNRVAEARRLDSGAAGLAGDPQSMAHDL